VTVSVAGHDLALRTDAKAKYIKELAAYVTRKVEEARTKGRTVTTQSHALLAAMTIADELHQLRESHAKLQRSVRERTERILRYLDLESDP
jgi:cell division protein ZapA (FtsZ GTPase activity inhibitor)